MKIEILKNLWLDDIRINDLERKIKNNEIKAISELPGSSIAFVVFALFQNLNNNFFLIAEDKESALHLFNDLELLFNDVDTELNNKKVLFFPASYVNAYDFTRQDGINLLYRNTVLHKLASNEKFIAVAYPQSFIEPSADAENIKKSHFTISLNELLSTDFLIEFLETYNFQQVDFVTLPGEYAVRGGIIDVFSYNSDYPYRIEFSGDQVASLRCFDVSTQKSIKHFSSINILSNITDFENNKLTSIFNLLISDTLFFTVSLTNIESVIEEEFKKFRNNENITQEEIDEKLKHFFCSSDVISSIKKHKHITYFKHYVDIENNVFPFKIKHHPVFNKNFDLFFEFLLNAKNKNQKVIIFSNHEINTKRLKAIIEDFENKHKIQFNETLSFCNEVIHEGFIDEERGFSYLTDHQIFERYHRYRFGEKHNLSEANIIKDLQSLKPGDYVVHVDYGIGRYAGLEKIEVQGSIKEAIRILYRDNDELLISIHSLHKISKYIASDGVEPKIDKLGSGSWQLKKNKAKSKVKDIARELIKLYAQRKQSKGYQFSPDTYLQHELEASFIYEDTEDQAKATIDVKRDMEASYPMDRLICGDVGFGKTEVAIRAAFKAACDNKQTVVLVPTTILAFQHYKTFSERLKNFPVTVDYLNRFRSTREVKEIIEKLAIGKIDIIIGTHKILNNEIKFKDLGLLIIDEEQKFGVAAKEKIRQMKFNIDTLTLTATPIPRTLQFSLLGARDLSIINTPPPNRYPIHTEVIQFNSKRIHEAIMYEVNRGGQVFFINNKIQNIEQVTEMLRKLCPDVRFEIGHGQMEGKKLEQIVLDFMEGKFEVFVCTAIIESGIDIPNANTIIINDAHNFGLSDLHQLRGRVGRSNKKAFCYLICPPMITLSQQARQRIKALIELSELGSGFNIAMRDLDIRGAGNLLGAEQSGFITEIGYDMYQKILDEAILELNYEENQAIIDYSDPSQFVKDCTVETDLSLYIPDSYISNINERLMIYKDIDSLQNEKQIESYKHYLIDRFGPLPYETIELINVVKMRLLARKLGIVKIIIKDKKLFAYFFKTNKEEFYSSEIYNNILNFVISNPKVCTMKQDDNEQMYLILSNITSVSGAIEIFEAIINYSKDK